MASVRLKNRRTGSVVVVPAEKADRLRILGFDAESESSAKKAPAKRAAAKN
jgi:hypothetical protein